ncbi:MAG: DUF2085 domain-containing protein [Chloroflexi bacterium]|nr:DUF2085 domain-containing protein [Chloroflexota bacterium]
MESPFANVPGLLRYVGLLLSGVCHQIPERTYFIGTQQLPLCARCTGTYLSALWTLGVMAVLGRARAARLPPARVLVALILFFLVWGIDGFNSYLSAIEGLPHFCTPHNIFRLATGMLNGLALMLILLPVFNFVIWQNSLDRPVVDGFGELVGLIIVVAVANSVVIWAPPAFFYPLALLEAVSVLVLLGMVNSVLFVILRRLENTISGWRELAVPLALGLMAAVVELCAIAALRAWLASLL